MRRYFGICPAASLAALACAIGTACESSAPSSPEIDAAGPAPLVEATPEFGIAPLSGYLRLTPPNGSSGWRYRVEPISTEPRAWEGVVDTPDSIPFRITEPGIHAIRVELEGPDGPVIVEARVIVSDPTTDFEILAQRPIAGLLETPEGIAIDPEGRWLYVAGYEEGRILRLDAGTLEVDGSIQLRYGVEGLSITPSGDRLVAVHQLRALSVVRLPSLELEWEDWGSGRFFAHALDDRNALVSGLALTLVDLDRRKVVTSAGGDNAWHFALDRTAQQVALVYGPDVEIRALPSLALLRSFAEIGYVLQLAFDPLEGKLYAMTSDRFLVLDSVTGKLLDTVTVGLGCRYCAANPVTTFASGRYVAFERTGAVDIVDTTLDLPRYRFASPTPVGHGPSAVAAVPDSDVLYVLGGPARAIYKLRVRNP